MLTKNTRRALLCSSALVVAINAGLLASAASAQDRSPASGGDASSAVEELVVTGTRITTSGYTAPTPVSVVDQEQIATSGTANVMDALLEMPQVNAGLSANNAANNTDGGAAFINLRGLGTNRSLTLVNGRRRVSGSSTSAAVDLNTIPAAMIERVEITTGGASAIYGADAVSGVVNLITKKHFDGLEFSANGGISDRGDAENYAFSAFGGTPFSDDRGYVDFAVTYSRTAQLDYDDRDYLAKRLSEQSNPASRTPTDGIPDRLTYENVQSYAYASNVLFLVANVPYQYGPNGLINVTPQTVFGTGATGSGVGSPGDFTNSLQNVRLGNQVVSMRSDLTYQLTPGVNFFAEGEFTRTKTAVPNQYYRFDSRALWFNETGGPIIQADNYYLPASVKTLMASAGLTTLPVNRTLIEELGNITDHHDRSTYSIVTGFDGELFDNWKWDVSYQYGQQNDDIQTPNLLRGPEFKNALDAVFNPATGQAQCRNAAARTAGCVPYNIFQRGPLTPAQTNYFVATRLQNTRNTQQIVGAHLSGDLFTLPAGPFAVAAGIERREEGLVTRDDAGMLNGNIRWGVGTSANARPSLNKTFTVTEQYVEVLAPIFRDLPFIKSLDINGAARASDYNTIGSTIAWAGGLNWTISDDVRLRVARSRSVRAPNLLELYGPVTVVLTSIGNPCGSSAINTTANRKSNCIALGAPATGGVNTVPQMQAISGGNADLTQEMSDSLTAGAVFTPGFIPNLRASIDFFDIEISDAVTTPDVFAGCLDAASMQGNPFCSRMTFSSDGLLLTRNTSLINAASLKTQGVDFSIDHHISVLETDRISVKLAGTYLRKQETLAQANDPATRSVAVGNYTRPRVRLNLTLRYDRPDWGVSITNRFIGGSKVDLTALPEARASNSVPSRTYTDLTLKYRLTDSVSGYVGINNALDIQPPQIAQTFDYGSIYDLVGRYVHAGVTAKF